MLPKKWYEVYPVGTKEGNEEEAVFKALSRNPKWIYRTVESISNATKLPEDRVREIFHKYTTVVQPPLIYQNEKNTELYVYWCNDPEVLNRNKKTSIVNMDHEKRLKRSNP